MQMRYSSLLHIESTVDLCMDLLGLTKSVAIYCFSLGLNGSRGPGVSFSNFRQEIGSAFYLSLASTSLLLFSFLLALVSTYYLIQDANKSHDGLISPVMRELVPLYNSTRHTAI
ncbi:unnamed protein product [Wuchereria bancrofti]|uniref:CASP-like protein n=1 Tax=Wuchereria bancrofti TaxID=6293 RepID=A0A3P7FYU9_WUCBA|nr:unnamed protein product [Wuchereria bancrofti]